MDFCLALGNNTNLKLWSAMQGVESIVSWESFTTNFIPERTAFLYLAANHYSADFNEIRATKLMPLR